MSAYHEVPVKRRKVKKINIHHCSCALVQYHAVSLQSCAVPCGLTTVMCSTMWSHYSHVQYHVVTTVMCSTMWSHYSHVQYHVVTTVMCSTMWSHYSHVQYHVVTTVMCSTMWSHYSLTTVQRRGKRHSPEKNGGCVDYPFM